MSEDIKILYGPLYYSCLPPRHLKLLVSYGCMIWWFSRNKTHSLESSGLRTELKAGWSYWATTSLCSGTVSEVTEIASTVSGGQLAVGRDTYATPHLHSNCNRTIGEVCRPSWARRRHSTECRTLTAADVRRGLLN